jgi:hypothetical protein
MMNRVKSRSLVTTVVLLAGVGFASAQGVGSAGGGAGGAASEKGMASGGHSGGPMGSGASGGEGASHNERMSRALGPNLARAAGPKVPLHAAASRAAGSARSPAHKSVAALKARATAASAATASECHDSQDRSVAGSFRSLSYVAADVVRPLVLVLLFYIEMESRD